jgi:hypothetical protein
MSGIFPTGDKTKRVSSQSACSVRSWFLFNSTLVIGVQACLNMKAPSLLKLLKLYEARVQAGIA